MSRDVIKVEQKFFFDTPRLFLKPHPVPIGVLEQSKTMLNIKLFGTFCAILEKIESSCGSRTEVQSGPYWRVGISATVRDALIVSTRAV